MRKDVPTYLALSKGVAPVYAENKETLPLLAIARKFPHCAPISMEARETLGGTVALVPGPYAIRREGGKEEMQRCRHEARPR